VRSWEATRWALTQTRAGSMECAEVAETELEREEATEAAVVVGAAGRAAKEAGWVAALARIGDDSPGDTAGGVAAGRTAAEEGDGRMVMDGRQDDRDGQDDRRYTAHGHKAASFPAMVASLDENHSEQDVGDASGNLGYAQAVGPVLGKVAVASGTASRRIDRSGSTRGTCPSAG
jgi:hypothetical protein